MIGSTFCRIDTVPRPPSSQKVICGSLLSGSATYFVSEINAEHRLDTTIPDSTRVSVDSLPRPTTVPTVYVTSTATRPSANAESCTAGPLHDSRIPIAAPSPAPPEAPSRSGETIGLRNSVW